MASLTILLDHSRLREASRRLHAAEIDRLRRLVAAGRAISVASFIHLYEMSRHPDHASNLVEARLIDSLSPRWLRLRINLLGDELRNALHRWRGETHAVRPVNPLHVSPSQYATGPALLVPGQDTAAGCVEIMHRRPDITAPVRRAVDSTQYVATLRDLMEQRRRGQRDYEAARDAGMRRLVSNLAPLRDNEGIFTQAAERARFAAELDPTEVPTLATELALLEARVARDFLSEASEQFDLQYAEAGLPYLDVLVADRQFSEAIRQASRNCPAIRARCFPTLDEAVSYLEEASAH